MKSSSSDASVVGTSIHKLFRGRNRQFAEQLIGIIESLSEYHPLTVRQVYYQAVAALLVPNKLPEYQRTSKILTALRRADLLSWDSIEDRTRRTIDKRGVPDLAAFVQEQAKGFLDWRYYHRCYVQEQKNYVEVATEKDALSSILSEAVWIYCTRLNVVRGQVSASMVKALADRFDRAIMRGQQPVLLYFGDLDPSGVAIPKALARNLEEHHSIPVEVRRIALNPAQVTEYDLPQSPDAAKRDDPNFSAWLREYGDQAPTELDALHPAALTEIVQAAMGEAYDLAEMGEQQERERLERRKLKRMRRDVVGYCRRQYPSLFRDVRG